MKKNISKEPAADYGNEPAKLPKSESEFMVENANRPYVHLKNIKNEPLD